MSSASTSPSWANAGPVRDEAQGKPGGPGHQAVAGGQRARLPASSAARTTKIRGPAFLLRAEGRVPPGPGGHRRGDSPGSDGRAADKPHHGTERSGCHQASEEQPGHGRLEVRRQGGKAAQNLDAIARIRPEEAELVQGDLVAGAGYDVVNLHLGGLPGRGLEGEQDLASFLTHLTYPQPVPDGNQAFHPISQPPGAQRTQHPLHQLEPGPGR